MFVTDVAVGKAHVTKKELLPKVFKKIQYHIHNDIKYVHTHTAICVLILLLVT